MPNLASRVLGLSLRRLSADIQAVHGYPVFLAETFVDISKFNGTCYRAANWHTLGLTRGFSRASGGPARFRHHGQPKALCQEPLPTDCQTDPDAATDGGPSATQPVCVIERDF